MSGFHRFVKKLLSFNEIQIDEVQTAFISVLDTRLKCQILDSSVRYKDIIVRYTDGRVKYKDTCVRQRDASDGILGTIIQNQIQGQKCLESMIQELNTIIQIIDKMMYVIDTKI